MHQSKFQHKAEKKALTKSLHAIKQKAAALKSEPLVTPVAAAAEGEEAPLAFSFDLPSPASFGSSTMHYQLPSA